MATFSETLVCFHDEIRRNSNYLHNLDGVELSAFEKDDFFDRVIEARLQRNSSTMMRVWKQRTDEHRTTLKTRSRRRKVTSVCDDQLLHRMAVNDRTAPSRQLTTRWSTATDILMPASSIGRRLLPRKIRARVPLHRISLTANHRRLHQQRIHEHRALQS
ncbi:transposable element Tcb2 transposase [Trichonephila clavipes]|nr:transposable element Tcb2 transposase [Trichonephila clavipes]